MDAKLTVSFDKETISKAKEYASEHGLSLSRMLEFLLKKVVNNKEEKMYDWPISDWVAELAEGPVEYKTRPYTNKEIRDEANDFKHRKKAS